MAALEKTLSATISFEDQVRSQVDSEDYWFHKMELLPGLVTPGWSDPKADKLPFYGLPDDMSGMRVLDVGCAEGFFSFEAERRGADEVIAIDSYPSSIRRFNICRAALNSNAVAYLSNVYDLNPKTIGTFDLVMFYGVLYHLRNPMLALEKIFKVSSGSLLIQTATYGDANRMVQTFRKVKRTAKTVLKVLRGANAQHDNNEHGIPLAKFYPFGLTSGHNNENVDPTVFWLPNNDCVEAMLASTGFENIKIVTANPQISLCMRAESPVRTAGTAPDETKAPWS